MSSWIPDWSQNLPIDLVFFYPEFLKQPTTNSYTIHSIPGAVEARLELRILGCRFGQVAHRSSVHSFKSFEDAAVQYSNLTQGYDAQGRIREESDEMGQEMINAIVRSGKASLKFYLSRGWCTMGEDWPISSEDAERIYEALQQCRLVLSSDGNPAIAPAAVECGDVFCLLSGAATVSILRPVPDGTWTLISGDCYMSGVPSHDMEPYWIEDHVSGHPDKREEFRIR